MYQKENTFRSEYKAIVKRYHDASPKIMIDEKITSPLAQDTLLTQSFWNRVAKLFESSDNIKFKPFVFQLLCRLAYALDNKNFPEWYSLNFKEECDQLLSLSDAIFKLENELKKIPKSALVVPRVSTLPDESGVRPQKLEFNLRWGDAKKIDSLHTEYSNDFIRLKKDIALRLHYLQNPHYEKILTSPPAKQTKNKQQAELLNELIIFFEEFSPKLPRQIIIDLCHIYGFDNVDDENIKNAQTRIKNIKNRHLYK